MKGILEPISFLSRATNFHRHLDAPFCPERLVDIKGFVWDSDYFGKLWRENDRLSTVNEPVYYYCMKSDRCLKS